MELQDNLQPKFVPDLALSTVHRILWIRCIKFHSAVKHPRDMVKREIEAFLSHLEVDRDVSASTQRQALNAIVFLYEEVLSLPVRESTEPVKANPKDPVERHFHLPVVLTQQEVKRVLNQMQGNHLTMAKLLYRGLSVNGVYTFTGRRPRF